jgi:hypothetical protein
MAQKTEGVTIAFLGTGAMDVDHATDLIEEYIEATITSDDDPVRFVFPLTTDEFSDTLGELVEMAKQSDITYEVITSTADKRSRTFADIASGAAKTYHVADVYTQIEQILTESPTSILEVLWDKEREDELTEILRPFVDAEIDVRDLTDGNVPMAENGEEDEGGEEAAPPAAAAEAPEEDASEAEIVYARSDLEKLSRADIKEIALKLNLPPRRSSDAMIEEIMEAQGGFDEDEPTTVTDVEVVVEEGGMVAEMIASVDSAELVVAIRDFPGQLHEVLDQFLTDLAKTVEGLVFNQTPADPPPDVIDHKATRRLSRAR